MTDETVDPNVPEQLLADAGFDLAERRTETLFRAGGVRIDGVTRRYEDDRSRTAVREATDGAIDHPIRFVAVTRLDFRPGLPPGLTVSAFASTLRSEARRSFRQRLEDRGLTGVQRGSSRRLRLAGRSRVRVREYSARDPLPEGDGRSLALTFRLSVLTYRDTALIVTAGFPVFPVAEQFTLTDPPATLTRDHDEHEKTFEEILGAVHERLRD